MKIVSLMAENVKRLSAIEIRPDGNLVKITGRNGQGKTSVLDSIFWALAGADHVQSMPIKRDATVARIRLDLGEITVTRTFKRKPDGLTTGLIVEAADGARYGSPQKMLDMLLGELSFDPLAFARMKPREQLDALRRFVPDVDFAKIENQNRGDFERRTDLNRMARQERGAEQAIAVPVDTPAERVDEEALVAELTAAGEHNASLERRRANRETVGAELKKLQDQINSVDQEIASIQQERQAQRDRRIAELEELIAQARQQCDEEISILTGQVRGRAQQAFNRHEDLKAQLEAAGPLPEAKDLASIQGRIAAARLVNGNVALLEQRTKHGNRAEQLEKQVQDLTDAMEARTRAKEQAIAAAKIPIEGIGFAEDHVTLNGVPFDQGSDAEQLRASVAIAMAMNPKLRVLRIRDGSLLDEDSMHILEQMCDKSDFQCWVEVVDSSGKIGFEISEGQLVSTPQTRKNPPAAERAAS